MSREQSSEKNSIMASRSCLLKASRICFKVSVVTVMLFDLFSICDLSFTWLLQLEMARKPVIIPMITICFIVSVLLQLFQARTAQGVA